MKIEILGAGCARCEKLTEIVKSVVAVMKIDAEVVHVRDMAKILESGVMMTPALFINGKEKAVGRVPSANEIKQWIIEAQS